MEKLEDVQLSCVPTDNRGQRKRIEMLQIQNKILNSGRDNEVLNCSCFTSLTLEV